MPYEEKPASKRTRLVWIVLGWILGVPFIVAMWLMLGWVSLILLAGMVWGTWDYYRKGDMFGAVDGIGREGALVPEAFREDNRAG